MQTMPTCCTVAACWVFSVFKKRNPIVLMPLCVWQLYVVCHRCEVAHLGVNPVVGGLFVVVVLWRGRGGECHDNIVHLLGFLWQRRRHVLCFGGAAQQTCRTCITFCSHRQEGPTVLVHANICTQPHHLAGDKSACWGAIAGPLALLTCSHCC